MNQNILDCSHEQTSMPTSLPDHMEWLASDLSTDDWLVRLDDQALEELHHLGRFINANPQQQLQRRLDPSDLPRCRALMADMKNRLDHGVGFSVLDRLPVDR